MSNDLSIFVQSGVLAAEAQKQLTTAVAAVAQVRRVSPPRHFERINRELQARLPSAISRARDVLGDLDEVWRGATKQFHKYRQMLFDMRHRQAKLALKRKQALEATSDEERAVAEAECDMEQAIIDGLAAELAEGEGEVKQVLADAAKQAERYTALGVTITEQDLLRDEAEYLVKSAFWHAAQVFKVIDLREPGARTVTTDSGVKKTKMPGHNEIAIHTPATLRSYFQALGILGSDVEAALRDLSQQRAAYMRMYEGHRRPPEFTHTFSWMQGLATKYAPHVLKLIDANGMGWLKRVQQMVEPTSANAGGDAHDKNDEMERRTVFE